MLSLRGLMVLVLVVGGLLGGWVRLTTVRREAIATIRAAGGFVVFRDKKPEASGFWVELYRRTGWGLAREVAEVSVMDSSPMGATNAPRPSRDEGFAAVGRLGRVRAVNVSGGVTPANLANLAGSEVEELELMWVDDLSVELLTQIGRLRSLKGLQIIEPKAGGNAATIRAIASMPQLERLILQGFTSLGGDDMVSLGQLTELKRLTMFLTRVDASFLDRWQTPKGIMTLDLPMSPISDARLRALVDQSPDLREIEFDGSLLTDVGVEALFKRPGLGRVEFPADPSNPHLLTDASLTTIGRLRSLSTLTMTTGGFTEEGLDALAGLPLNTLTIGSVESISEAGMKRLVAGRTFTRLALAGPAITDAILPLLAGHLDPRGKLDLSRSAITDDGMRHLIPLRLDELQLNHTALTDAGLATLASGTTVRSVFASDTKVTPAGAAAFRAARPGTRLWLGWADVEN